MPDLGIRMAHFDLLSVALCFLAGFLFFGTGCAGREPAPPAPEKEARRFPAVEEEWGISPLTLRLSGADHFLDFRYRIIDPEKASGMMGRDQKAYLIHEPSGTRLPVPITKLGPLKGSSLNPKPDRVYAVLFNNLGKVVGGGDPVTIVIGKMRLEGMSVEAPPGPASSPAAGTE